MHEVTLFWKFPDDVMKDRGDSTQNFSLLDKALYFTEMVLEAPQWWAPEGQQGAKHSTEGAGICSSLQGHMSFLPRILSDKAALAT